MEGVNITGPAIVVVGTVPGVGVVTGLGLVLNNVCIKLSGIGGTTGVVTGIVEISDGRRVPIKNDSGREDGTPCMDVMPRHGNAG